MSIITGLISNFFFLIFLVFCGMVVWNGNHIALLPGWAWLVYLCSMVVAMFLKPFQLRRLALFLLPFCLVCVLGLLGQPAAASARKIQFASISLLDVERFVLWAAMIVLAPGWTLYALGRAFGGKDLRLWERLRRLQRKA